MSKPRLRIFNDGRMLLTVDGDEVWLHPVKNRKRPHWSVKGSGMEFLFDNLRDPCFWMETIIVNVRHRRRFTNAHKSIVWAQPIEPSINQAAITGDLSAALNQR